VVKGVALAALFLFPHASFALGPHECVLILNRNSSASKEIANYYADLRQIPVSNIVELDIPPAWLAAGASITPDEFRTRIYDKVNKVISSRRLPHILVWIYSADFPSTISTVPPLSLTGMTFVRGNPPSTELVQSGRWPSPLFAGPDQADGPSAPSLTMENQAIKLTTNMPLPSMMLGWRGSRGLSTSEIKDHLRNSMLSDGSAPSGTFFMETSEDIRSKTRAWQFARVKRELGQAGFDVSASAEAPSSRTPLIGMMLGRADYEPRSFGRLSSGAYADSLTSYGALFHVAEQTKLTAWLKSGAAGTSGTITEPGSLEVPVILWPKFPSARIFTHYTAGCTLLESFYLATRSPLQILAVGDPLCRPWGQAPMITLLALSGDEKAALSGKAEFMASLGGVFAGGKPDIMFLMDGRPILSPQKGDPVLGMDTTGIADGYHDLRAVAYAQGLVRHQGFSSLKFEVRNRSRSLSITGYTNNEIVSSRSTIDFRIESDNPPDEVRITANGRELARSVYATNMQIKVDSSTAGLGLIEFHAIGIYKTPELVRSKPIKLNVMDLNRAPVISTRIAATNDGGLIEAVMDARDPDGDTVSSRWHLDLIRLDMPEGRNPVEQSGIVSASPSTITLADPTNQVRLVYPLDQPNRINTLHCRFQLTGSGPVDARHRAGIIFNYQDSGNYLWWGMHGGLSAWVMQRVQDGEERIVFSRGAPLNAGVDHALAIESAGDDRLAFKADGAIIGTLDMSFAAGKCGLLAGSAAVTYQGLLVSPPLAVDSRYGGAGERIAYGASAHLNPASLSASADDGRTMTVIALTP